MSIKKEEFAGVAVKASEFASICGLEIISGSPDAFIKFSTVSISRPGLILTGYTDYFADTRIQMLGKSEITFLGSLDSVERQAKLSTFFATSIPCVIVSRNQRIPKYLSEAALINNVPLFRSPKVTAITINEITAYLNELLAPRTSMHGMMLDVFGCGVLLTGESGIGKSETSLELLHRGHRLVSDDVVDFMAVKNKLYGTSPKVTKHLMEIRGVGIIDIKAIYGVGAVSDRKRLDLIIHLERWNDDKEYERVGNNLLSDTILGVEVPKYLIPVTAGRNIAIITEVAVRDFRLKQDGINTLAELEKRMED